MKTKRTPRFKREPQQVGGLRLQERDIEIIKLVHDFRFLNSHQIELLVNTKAFSPWLSRQTSSPNCLPFKRHPKDGLRSGG